MKDTSRPWHLAPSSRSAPYRKRKSSGTISPTRGTRRAFQGTHEIIFSRSLDRARSLRRDEIQTSRTTFSAEDDGRSSSNPWGNRAVPHSRRHTSMDESVRERPSHTSALSTRADVSGPSLRLPTSTGGAVTSQRRAESPPPGSVTTFLRSIELPDKPSSAPPLQTSFSPAPPSLRIPPLSTDNTNKPACANGNGYQISLVYKGYPFTYDLSALPDDPKGTIALLTITKSDPGAYILVGAHYRRTGRSRAAGTVIRSLLDNLGHPSDVEKEKGDAVPIPTLATSTVTSTAIRPAMLLLAACELDISREYPNDPDGASHASTAHNLFRAVYGTINDAIIAGAVRPQPKNALGLEFSSNRNCPSFPPSDLNSHPPSSTLVSAESLARVKDLEKELSAARVTQEKLQEKLIASDDRLTRAEGKVHALESYSREVDAWRDENWELRQRLAESERMVKDLAQCAPSTESRVWGRLKDMLFDNFGGGGVRGE